jgi:hypothetical protein
VLIDDAPLAKRRRKKTGGNVTKMMFTATMINNPASDCLPLWLRITSSSKLFGKQSLLGF